MISAGRTGGRGAQAWSAGLRSWLTGIRPQPQGSQGGRAGRAARRDQFRPGRHGNRAAGRGEPRLRAVRVVLRQDRRRPVHQHQADGRHHHDGRLAGRWLRRWPTSRRPTGTAAIITLTILTGMVMIAAGLLHLGRYIRFVSRSVMLGFLTGVGGEHRVRSVARPGRLADGGWRRGPEGLVRHHPPDRDHHGVGDRRGVGAGGDVPAQPNQVGAVRHADRRRGADDRGGGDGRSTTSDGGRCRCDPQRAAAAGAAAAGGPDRRGDQRGLRDRRDRAGPGRRGGGGSAEPGRLVER